jgi:hypothetical protein
MFFKVERKELEKRAVERLAKVEKRADEQKEEMRRWHEQHKDDIRLDHEKEVRLAPKWVIKRNNFERI